MLPSAQGANQFDYRYGRPASTIDPAGRGRRAAYILRPDAILAGHERDSNTIRPLPAGAGSVPVRIRSPRDPGFWLPVVLVLIVLLPLAIAVYVQMTDYIAELETLAAADPEAALARAAAFLRRAVWGMCVLLGAFCLYFFRYSQLGRREGRLPPSGWWSFGALHAVVGERAQRIGRFGQWLAAALLIATIGFGLAVEHLARLIETGRMGI